MTVAILSALQTEIELLIESVDEPRREDISGWPIWFGTINGRPAVLARTGLGKVNAAALTTLIWHIYQPGIFVFTGVAGGLDPELEIGDIVVGEHTIQHDAGVIGAGGRLERYQAGHIPFFNPTDQFGFAPSTALLESMRVVADMTPLSPVLEREPVITYGTILTGDQFLHDPDTRDRLYRELNAQAIEMEGAALAQVAERVGVDHVVIRSLSDLAGVEATHDFDRFLPEVSANSARLVLSLLSRLEEHDRDHPIGS